MRAHQLRQLSRRLPPAQAVAGWALLLLLLPAAGLLALRPDERDAMRAADRLFTAGRYYEALRAYQDLDPATLPEAALRLGALRALRGERAPAERALRAAMQAGLRPADYQLALLYLGQVLAEDGRAALAARTWALMADCRSAAACAYGGPGLLLAAEQGLRRGDYAGAEAGYRAALAARPPPEWAALARGRLALLLAARDPAAALAALAAAPPAAPAAPTSPLLGPLLPAPGAAEGLDAVLASDPALRPQLLGELYVSQGLYGLAEAQFALVDPRGPNALAAAAYAAYARWRSGDRAAGLLQLEALVRRNPDQPRARTLLALAYLAADDSEAARAQIDTVARLSPRDPDVHLAWANWRAARREYPEASLEYDLALAQATQPAQRGRYALIGARFHLATSYELCQNGLPQAEAAAASMPADGGALTTMAAYNYYCGRLGAAQASAQAALDAGGGAEAAYYLGATLVALGQPDAARAALIRAADLAPASVWRERAEKALAQLP